MLILTFRMLPGIHGNAFLSDSNGAVTSVVNGRTFSINWALQDITFTITFIHLIDINT